MSHPVWVCGLKLHILNVPAAYIKSHPVWVCGLKPLLPLRLRPALSHTLYGCVDWNPKSMRVPLRLESHTLYGCVDWNQFNILVDIFLHVTPCMGVWIETIYPGESQAGSNVTPCMGVWIETAWSLLGNKKWECHTLYGCVDWNSDDRKNLTALCRHTLYGCVDWNPSLFQASSTVTRHTLYGCVDWNPCFMPWAMRTRLSHPVWVCGLKLCLG